MYNRDFLGFGVRVRVVSSCFTDVCNSIILFLFSSKGTDIDENIANQNHATRTRTPKPGYLNLSNRQYCIVVRASLKSILG